MSVLVVSGFDSSDVAWEHVHGRRFAPQADPGERGSGRPDAHDIICLLQWEVVILPDATVYPPNNIEIVRPLDEASERVMRRHNRHWLREHAASYPEAPIP